MEAAIPPSTQRFLATLPKIKLKHLSRENRECSMCLEKFSPHPHAEHPVRLPCGHIFGSSCIRTWTSSSSSSSSSSSMSKLLTPPTCPLCRSELAPPRSSIDRWELFAFIMQQDPYLSACQTLHPTGMSRNCDSATELVRLFYRVVLQIVEHHRRHRIPASALLLKSAQAVACRMGGLLVLLGDEMRSCRVSVPWGQSGPSAVFVLDPRLESTFEAALERMVWVERRLVSEFGVDV